MSHSNVAVKETTRAGEGKLTVDADDLAHGNSWVFETGKNTFVGSERAEAGQR